MIVFGRTQRSIQTPFEPLRNPGFGGLPSTISSTDVQNAIEEAKISAFNNDRYPFIASYGGNANVGRYLELFPGLDSLAAPFIVPENSIIKTVTLGNTAISTGTVGFFKSTNLVTPVFSLSLTAQISNVFSSLSYAFNQGDKVSIRITAGSLKKPYMRVWVNTAG